jgi:hypothetical protein
MNTQTDDWKVWCGLVERIQVCGTATTPADADVRARYAQISAPYQPKDRCSYCGARDNGKDQFCAGCGAPL